MILMMLGHEFRAAYEGIRGWVFWYCFIEILN